MPPLSAPRILPEAISTGGDSAAVNTSLAMAVLPLRWGSVPRPQRRWGISFPPVPPVLTGDYQVPQLSRRTAGRPPCIVMSGTFWELMPKNQGRREFQLETASDPKAVIRPG